MATGGRGKRTGWIVGGIAGAAVVGIGIAVLTRPGASSAAAAPAFTFDETSVGTVAAQPGGAVTVVVQVTNTGGAPGVPAITGTNSLNGSVVGDWVQAEHPTIAPQQTEPVTMTCNVGDAYSDVTEDITFQVTAA